MRQDQNDSLEVAETLKVLEAIVADDRIAYSTNTIPTALVRAPTKTEKKIAIKQSRKFVDEALQKFTEQLK